MEHEDVKRGLDAEFVGRGRAPAATRAHLRVCDACRAYYDRLVDLERLLENGAEVPRAQRERLVARGVSPRARSASTRSRAAAAAITALAASLAFLWMRAGEFTPRGGTDRGRQAWIRIFSRSAAETSPLGGKLAAKDALLFAYTNLKDSPYRYLIIAGRDAAGHVHWYHPAYTSPGDDPESIPLETGVADRELREELRAQYMPGRLEICAVFTRAPLRVSAVDRALERGERWPDGGHLDCRDVEVQP